MKEERQERTDRKREFVQSLGITYIELWECEFYDKLRTDPALNAFAEAQAPTFYKEFRYKHPTEEDFIEAMKSDIFFGALEVDIHVPSHLYSKFCELSPLFVTMTIPKEVIGETMQKVWDETQQLPNGEVRPFPEKRLLVGGMRAEKILLATPLLQFYLRHGLIVTKVYEVFLSTSS